MQVLWKNRVDLKVPKLANMVGLLMRWETAEVRL